MTASDTRPPDTNVETPNGQEGGLHKEVQSKRTGLDEFEYNLKVAICKSSTVVFSEKIGTALADLGDAELDDEPTRRYREFLVRLLTDPVSAIALISVPGDEDARRVHFTFAGEPSWSPYHIEAQLIDAVWLAVHARNAKGCPLSVSEMLGGGA